MSTVRLFWKGMACGFRDAEFRGWISLILFLFVFGAIGYHLIEGFDWLDSFYFSMSVMTTLGLGDLAPVTPLGKLLTIFLGFSGVTVVLGFISAAVVHVRREHHETPHSHE